MCDPRKPAPPVTREVGISRSGYLRTPTLVAVGLEQHACERTGPAEGQRTFEAGAVLGRPRGAAEEANRVALPVVRVHARDPAAHVGLEDQRVPRHLEQRVDLDEDAR